MKSKTATDYDAALRRIRRIETQDELKNVISSFGFTLVLVFLTLVVGIFIGLALK